MLVNVLEMAGHITAPRHHSCPGGAENLGVTLDNAVDFFRSALGSAEWLVG